MNYNWAMFLATSRNSRKISSLILSLKNIIDVDYRKALPLILTLEKYGVDFNKDFDYRKFASFGVCLFVF